MTSMRPAYVVQIVTPKKFILNGLWFGPKKPKRAIIFVHGLTGSAFSMQRTVGALVDAKTAVITFNNRGFEQITSIKRMRGQKTEYVTAGAAHERFTDCSDDIQGAVNTVRKAGVKNVYLAGHSTGCQKAYYWASKSKGGRSVKGIVLLGPLSDYAIALAEDTKGSLKKSIAHARKLVKSGKPHELMPKDVGPWFVCDAQRFLSLYTPESVEDTFPYGQKKNPKLMNSVSVPTLVLLAGADEHGDRPAREIGRWFEKHLNNGRVAIVPRVQHSFHGGEKVVAREIRRFVTK